MRCSQCTVAQIYPQMSLRAKLHSKLKIDVRGFQSMVYANFSLSPVAEPSASSTESYVQIRSPLPHILQVFEGIMDVNHVSNLTISKFSSP